MSIDTTVVLPQEEAQEENPIIALARQGTRRDLLKFYAQVANMEEVEEHKRSIYQQVANALNKEWRSESESALSDLRIHVLKEEEGQQMEEDLPLVEEAIQAFGVCLPLLTHFSVSGIELRVAISKLKDAVSTRSTLPVLSNVLLELDQEQGLLCLSATNLEIAIRTSVEAHIECAGDNPLTFPYALLVDECEQIPATNEGKMRRITLQEIIEKIPGGQVTKVQITNGPISTNYKKSIDASEFPLIPMVRDVELPTPFVFQSQDLRRIISLVAFAAAEDDSRPVLTGVLVQLKPGETSREIELAAADAFRLAAITYSSLFMPQYNPYDENAPRRMLIPARALLTLLGGTKEKKSQLLPEGMSDVFFYPMTKPGVDSDGNPHRPHQVQITIPGSNVTLVSRLIDGIFPDFYQIIPKNGQYGVYAEASVTALKKAYKGLKVFAKDSSNITRFMIEQVVPEEDEVDYRAWVKAETEDLGERTITITEDIHNVDFDRHGDESRLFGIIFNLKYMLDLLDHLEKCKIERVRIYLQAPTKPGKLVPIGLENYSYTIMPMHINR